MCMCQLTHVPNFLLPLFIKGKRERDVIKHMLRAVATLGVPEVAKTDNGSAYVSQFMKSFFHSGITQREIFFFLVL